MSTALSFVFFSRRRQCPPVPAQQSPTSTRPISPVPAPSFLGTADSSSSPPLHRSPHRTRSPYRRESDCDEVGSQRRPLQPPAARLPTVVVVVASRQGPQFAAAALSTTTTTTTANFPPRHRASLARPPPPSPTAICSGKPDHATSIASFFVLCSLSGRV